MRVRAPDTSSIQRPMAEFTTINPEGSVTGSENTESGIRNRILALGGYESTQSGAIPTNIGDCDVARGDLADNNDASIYFGYNRR